MPYRRLMLPPGGRELHGVSEQVVHDALQLLHVHVGETLFRTDVGNQRQSLSLRQRGERFVPASHQPVDVGSLYVHRHLPVLRLSEIKNLVDEVEQYRHVALRNSQHRYDVASLLRHRHRPVYRSGDKVQRRAEIVRDICEEHQSGICRLLKSARHVPELSVLFNQYVLLFVQASVCFPSQHVQAAESGA